MRYLLPLFLLLASCSSSRGVFTRVFGQDADSSQLAAKPLIFSLENEGQTTPRVLVVGDAGKKNTFIFQTGTGNSASNTKTDNTGRAADAGANGGNSQPTTTNKTPLWAIGLVLLVGAAGGIWCWSKWQAWRARPG